MDTSAFGWPISAPIKRVGSKLYVEARETLSPYGYFNAKQCKKGVYKQLEDFLKHFGLKESDIYLDKNSRSFISAEAFILTVIAGSKLRDETINSCSQCPWGQLCMFFAETVVSTTFAREIAGESASRTLNMAASSTPSLTQITVVETGSTQDTSTAAPDSKVYKGCVKPHEATSVLAKRLKEGKVSRSTQLEERVKKQRKILIELAQEVHHGSKIDLLHGISVAVGRRFREECDSDSVLPSCQLQQMMSPKLTEALERTSQNINDIDCVKLIWWHFYQMYRILRKDTAQPKPECTIGSTNVEDYEFGLSDAEIVRYVHHANMFHSLMIFRYGCKEITPYMMKFVDVVPKHLYSTPFKSLMRIATEGGERTHYMHMCFYYQHSTRDGGLHKPDTILMLLSWSYRNLRERINDCPEQIRTDFEHFAQRHVAAYTIQKWWKTVYTRPNTLVTVSSESVVQQPLPLSKMDFVLVGRMPGTTQKKFAEKVDQNGGRVISMPKENLPHERCYLVCSEEEVKRDSSKLNSDLVAAYRRGWTVVKPSFIEWATKEKTTPNTEEHALNLAPLAALSTSACGATVQSVEQLRFSKEISGFAALKRKIREQDKSPGNLNGNASEARVHKKKKDVMVSPLKPPNGWTAFLNEKLKERVQDNQSPGRTERITFVKSIQNMSTEWRRLSDEEKREYKEKAHELHLKRRQRRREIREETKENQWREKLREKAYETFSRIRSQ